MAETDQVYPLDPEKVYFSMDELTLDTDEGPKTLRVGSWLNYDPPDDRPREDDAGGHIRGL